MGVNNMLIHGYYGINNRQIMDYECCHFCNNINEMLSFVYYSDEITNTLNDMWDKCKNDINDNYIISICGDDDISICIFDNNMYVWHCIDFNEIQTGKIDNIDNWINENYSVENNRKIIHMLFNNHIVGDE